MQYQLLLFPEYTKLINDRISFYQQSNFVYYMHNGSPIFCPTFPLLPTTVFVGLVTALAATPPPFTNASQT